MEEFFGADVLYANAEGAERAMADVDIQRLLSVRAELIIENWDPQKVQVRNIPFLAFGMGVSLWEPDFWSIATQRQWIADQWEFKARRGTTRAERMALGVSGYELVQEIAPPQGFFVLDDTGVEGVVGSSFIGVDRVGFPSYTVYSLIDLKMKNQYGFFIDASYIDVDFIEDDDLSDYERGRRAVIAAKALRDEIFVDFATLRRLTVGDGLLSGRRVGDWILKADPVLLPPPPDDYSLPALSFSVGSPTLLSGSFSTVAFFSTGSPTLQSGLVSQMHMIVAAPLSTGSPSLMAGRMPGILTVNGGALLVGGKRLVI